FRSVCEMAINRSAMFLHFDEQMWRCGRGNTLGSEMTSDIEVSRILPFFDGLVLLASFAHFFLLSATALFKGTIAPFKLTAYARNIFIRRGHSCFFRCQFLFRGAQRFRASQ